MKPTIRAAALLLVVGAILPVVPAAAGAAAPDTVVIGTAQEPNLLGLFSVMVAARLVEDALFAVTATYTDRWTLRPVVMEKLPTIKDGDWVVLPNKKMKVTWRLRRDFTWHDGRKLTALDYRFTFGMVRNPQTPEVSRRIVRRVDNVLIPNPNDPYTMVVQWNELYPFAGSSPFGEEPYPRHLLERDYLRDPAKMMVHPYWRSPVHAGPYRFVEWIPGSHITLEAYEKFPLGTPRIKRMVFRFILDTATITANVIAGGLDATENVGFDCATLEQIERRNPSMRANLREALSIERIDFNLDNAWLKDRRVRQAIAYAVDRQAIADLTCSGGRQPVAHTWLPPAHPGHNPNVRKYSFDPARARALLREAGFTQGPDGILRDTTGRRVEMTIMSTAGNAIREQVELVMREHLKAVGIDLRIDNRPSNVFLGPVLNRREFPFLAMYGSLFSLESIPSNRFHSTQIPTAQNNWEGDNRPGWRNTDNDRIWEQLESELDDQRRIALLKRQQEIFAEDLPWLPLYFRLSRTVSHRRLLNVRPTGLSGTYIAWNSWEWRWADR